MDFGLFEEGAVQQPFLRCERDPIVSYDKIIGMSPKAEEALKFRDELAAAVEKPKTMGQALRAAIDTAQTVLELPLDRFVIGRSPLELHTLRFGTYDNVMQLLKTALIATLGQQVPMRNSTPMYRECAQLMAAG